MTFERLLGGSLAGTGFYPVRGIDTTGATSASARATATIAEAVAGGGGIVLLPPGRIGFATQVDVPSKVQVWGCGGDALKGSVSDPTFSPITTVVALTSGMTVFRCIRTSGVSFRSFAIDGGNIASKGWHLTAFQGGSMYDVSSINFGSQNNPAVAGTVLQVESDIWRMTGDTHNGTKILDNLSGSTSNLLVGMAVTGSNIPGGTTIASILSNNSVQTSANSTGDATGQAIVFSRAINSGNGAYFSHLNLSGARCIYLDGDSTADTCITGFNRVQCLYGSGTGNEAGIDINVADNILWTGVYCFKNFGTGGGVHLGPGARDHLFVHVYPGTTGIIADTPTTATWGNQVILYQRGDGAPAPTLAAGAHLAYSEESVNATGWYQDQDMIINEIGKGYRVKEGTNAKQGIATLGAAGTSVVSNTSVTANSRIFLAVQTGAFAGAMRVSARTPGTSFTIASSAGAADNGATVAWEMFEPA